MLRLHRTCGLRTVVGVLLFAVAVSAATGCTYCGPDAKAELQKQLENANVYIKKVQEQLKLCRNGPGSDLATARTCVEKISAYLSELHTHRDAIRKAVENCDRISLVRTLERVSDILKGIERVLHALEPIIRIVPHLLADTNRQIRLVASAHKDLGGGGIAGLGDPDQGVFAIDTSSHVVVRNADYDPDEAFIVRASGEIVAELALDAAEPTVTIDFTLAFELSEFLTDQLEIHGGPVQLRASRDDEIYPGGWRVLFDDWVDVTLTDLDASVPQHARIPIHFDADGTALTISTGGLVESTEIFPIPPDDGEGNGFLVASELQPEVPANVTIGLAPPGTPFRAYVSRHLTADRDLELSPGNAWWLHPDRQRLFAEGATDSDGSATVRFVPSAADDGRSLFFQVAYDTEPPRASPIFGLHVTRPFRRGDANGDAAVDIGDVATVLSWLFLSGRDPGCLRACDTNADGAVNVSDPIYLLDVLFLGAETLAPPGADECGNGFDADDVELGCREYAVCES